MTRPDIETFLLFTGDKDFIRLVTTLRNRLGKKVVICGVPGSISPDLVVAAPDTLQFAPSIDIDRQIIQAIDAYVRQLHDGFVPTQSHMSRTLWRFVDRAILPSEHIEAKVMEFLRKGILTKRQTINGQGQELVMTELNPAHPWCRTRCRGSRVICSTSTSPRMSSKWTSTRTTSNRPLKSRISRTTEAT